MIRVSYAVGGGYDTDVYPGADDWEVDNRDRLYLYAHRETESGAKHRVRVATYASGQWADVHLAGEEKDDPEFDGGDQTVHVQMLPSGLFPGTTPLARDSGS
jgi:hypothetical protein